VELQADNASDARRVALARVGEGWTILGLTTRISRLEFLIQAIINALSYSLVFSGVAYAATKYLLGGSGNYAVFLRMTGFAYPTLLVVIFTSQIDLPTYAALVAGSLWFLAVITRGINVEGDLPLPQAALAAVAGFVGTTIILSILGRGVI